MNDINPSELAERLRLAWEDWAIKNGEAEAQEEACKRLHAQIMLECGNIPVSKAKVHADIDDRYHAAVSKRIKAGVEANKARGLRDAMAVMIDLIRSVESSKRAELQRLR